ncbi:hypothetical protein CYY_003926 [Polysphondylium violaceum]|uniref:RING-type E3 ubiquitin transferase n=1 Tax=Polysphondylium violaceum TaxID=133409 RepID=A0A8J4PX01_9MYCE|nr:hypothetical protein CYY_003926 [Polysphondylium violaceum]
MGVATSKEIQEMEFKLRGIGIDPSDILSMYIKPSKFNNSADEKKNILCNFYIQGTCRHLDSCRFVHGDLCEICLKPMLIPGDELQNVQHQTECAFYQENLKKREEMKEIECLICYESVVDKGRKFGLLSECDHPFCLECIRSWRGNTKSDRSKHDIRLCPLCRKTSYLILPSPIYVIGEKKQEVCDLYKLKLSTIPCKYYTNSGFCKFGASCLYNHLDSENSDDDDEDDGDENNMGYDNQQCYYNQQQIYRQYQEDDDDDDDDLYVDEEFYQEEEEEEEEDDSSYDSSESDYTD